MCSAFSTPSIGEMTAACVDRIKRRLLSSHVSRSSRDEFTPGADGSPEETGANGRR